MPNQTKWAIDPEQSVIEFRVAPLIFSAVKGSFKIFDATISTTGNDFGTVKINLWIDASSINTGEMERDEQLKSADFFDVKKYKQITFTSNTVKLLKEDEKKYELIGNLTMKGITKELKIEVQSEDFLDNGSGTDKAIFLVTGELNRKDWGVIFYGASKKEGLMESEEVSISCKVTLAGKHSD